MEPYSYSGSLAGRAVALGSMLYRESAVSAMPLDPSLGDVPLEDLSSRTGFHPHLDGRAAGPQCWSELQEAREQWPGPAEPLV